MNRSDRVGDRVLHPRHGPHRPATATPPRRPGSVRRTTTHDSVRPQGLLGPVEVEARGRDLFTGPGSEPVVVATARLDAVVDYVPDRTITSIDLDPPHPGVASLAGSRAKGGFRKAVAEALPDEPRTGSLRFQLLDELPAALLVSGMAIAAGGALPQRAVAAGAPPPSTTPGSAAPPTARPPGATAPATPGLPPADLCAGWARGATILAELEVTGRVPLPTGPVAPALEVEGADDPWAWHEVPPLPPHGMRRRRRLDVWPGEDGNTQVETFFRDSHVDGDGVETVVHEYTVRAVIDRAAGTFVSCEANAGVLPWTECPGALASAQRLAGTPAMGLRGRVREAFVGPSTCTHLNDTLRFLEDLPALLHILDART